MIIGIVSDTHRDLEALKKGLEALGEIDVLIHLGDHDNDIQKVDHQIKEIYCVKGNTDVGSDEPEEMILELGSKCFFICHGHHYNVKSGLNNLYFRALEIEADVVLFGHSHRALVQWEKNILFLNPGSPSRPVGGCNPSVAKVMINGDEIKTQLLEI